MPMDAGLLVALVKDLLLVDHIELVELLLVGAVVDISRQSLLLLLLLEAALAIAVVGSVDASEVGVRHGHAGLILLTGPAAHGRVGVLRLLLLLLLRKCILLIEWLESGLWPHIDSIVLPHIAGLLLHRHHLERCGVSASSQHAGAALLELGHPVRLLLLILVGDGGPRGAAGQELGAAVLAARRLHLLEVLPVRRRGCHAAEGRLLPRSLT